MAKKKPEKIVRCRYPKCKFLHESTELKKEDAIKGGKGSSYYHPDCYHTMQTICKIRDLFVKEINPAMTGKQIGALVSTVNHIVFTKGIDVNFIEFALEYYIKNKPGAINYPYGIHYIIQNKDVITAWKKQKEQEIRGGIKAQSQELQSTEAEEIDLSEKDFEYNPPAPIGFQDILE